MARILVVEDNDDIRDLIRQHLVFEGHDVLEAVNGRQGVEVCREKRPALVVLDIMMPDMDGLEACRHLREDPVTATTFIIMLSAKSAIADRIVGLDTGADSYLPKPFDPDELHAMVRAGLRAVEDRRHATHDALTKLPNRRSFDQMIARELAATLRYGHSLSLVMADLDHFKKVNDTFGHGVGDVVLKELANRLRILSRPTDLPFRWGGEEFAWLLPETNIQGAQVAAERFRVAVESERFEKAGRLTVSLGVAEAVAIEGASELCENADEALYRAKEKGRNRVESYRNGVVSLNRVNARQRS